MKGNCDKYIELILSTDDNYSDEVKAHISRCNECRAMASEWKVVREMAEQIEVPDLLDSKVRRRISSRRKRGTKFVLSWSRISYIAAAACVILIASVFMFSDKRRETVQYGSNLKWHSHIDSEIFELDTELELNRELINFGKDEDKIDYEKLLFPQSDGETVISTDSWI